MRRILVVADRVVGGAALRERLALKRSTDPDMEVYVLVPQTPSDQPEAGADSGDARAYAERNLELQLGELRDFQYKVEGSVGDPDPIVAVRTLLRERPFDEIIVATAAPAASGWLRRDLVRRLERVTKLPVDRVVGEPAEVAEEAQAAGQRFPGVPPAAEEGQPVRVLVVEDDAADAELTRLALQRCRTRNTVELASNGAEALDWMRGAGGAAAVDLVLVDLKMPVVDGFELLDQLRQEYDLDQLAVTVLTNSDRTEDRERAHALGAHAYVVKEASFPLYCDLLGSLLSDVARVN
jgi:CheY-like chemotaxis protein